MRGRGRGHGGVGGGAAGCRAAAAPLLALLSVSAPLPAGAQVPDPGEGAVEGVVFDSTQGAPLAGATVVLWDTPHRAVTGAVGSFAIEGVPPGRYSVFFFHPRLASLGLTPGPATVSVVAGETASVRLAVPSMHTVLAAQCVLSADAGDAAGGAGRGVPLVGRVVDGASGIALPRSRVRVSWPGGVGGDRSAGDMEVLTDNAGWYRLCSVPPGVGVAATATVPGRGAVRGEVELAPGTPGRLDLVVGAGGEAELLGLVLDAESGEPLPGARVSLAGPGPPRSTVTDVEGRFRFADLAAGRYDLVLDHFTHGTRNETVEVAEAARTSAVLQLSTEPIALPELEVTVDRQPLTERATGGMLVTRSQIEELSGRARDAASVLRELHLRGVVVERRGADACVGFTTGAVRMRRRGGCHPAMVFVDGVKLANPMDGFMLPADAIERMVVYRPVEAATLFGYGSAAGVIQIFTKLH